MNCSKMNHNPAHGDYARKYQPLLKPSNRKIITLIPYTLSSTRDATNTTKQPPKPAKEDVQREQEQATQKNKQQPNIVWRLASTASVESALKATQCYLGDKEDIPNPRQDALRLLGYTLQKDQAWLFANYEYQLTIEEVELYTDFIRRRVDKESVDQLITSSNTI